ncbi:MAG TPA: hypothetical protein VEI74_06820 [Candidatus Methylomirabilis sp.]|nr:hypothetical protein [Candidatus Methylomirabilis sp.]
MRWLLCAGLSLWLPPAAAQESANFDVSQYEKKSFEFNGYAELKAEQFTFDRQAALYQLGLFDQPPRDGFDRGTGTLQLEGVYRHGITTAHVLAHGSYARDYTGNDRDTRFYEAYVSAQPSSQGNYDLGKKTLSWGKGYAWNPVGFVQRPKDPNDPDLAREGFVMAGADFVRSFDGTLKTVALTPLVVPTTAGLNADFGTPDHLNPAVKAYFLYADTDIDFMMLGTGAKSSRYGFDFSRNLGTNLEIHGEWAHAASVTRPVVQAAGNVVPIEAPATSYLLGLRYLSERELTTILEYYYNGAGYSEDEMRTFASVVHSAYAQYQVTGNAAPLTMLRTALQPALAQPNPGQRYLYLRLSQSEPFDVLYFTPALTTITNVDDHSYSIAPELLYTGVTNLELRFRVFWLRGAQLTDFGEKQNDRRLELRARYYF